MKRGSKKYVLEMPDFRAYVKLVAEDRMTVGEVCRRVNISRSSYYRLSKELDKQLKS